MRVGGISARCCPRPTFKESEVSEMYQIYAMLGVMLMTWVAAIWASNVEEKV